MYYEWQFARHADVSSQGGNMSNIKIKTLLNNLIKSTDTINDKKAVAVIKELVDFISGLEEENVLSGKAKQQLKSSISQFVVAQGKQYCRKKVKSPDHIAVDEETETNNIARLKIQQTLDAAKLGYWILNLKTNRVEHSLLHDQIFGYESVLSEWTYDMFLAHLHQDDQERVDRSFKEAIAMGAHYEQEFRICLADDKNTRWVWYSGRPLEIEETPYYLGVIQDITERKTIELELLRMSNKFNTLFEAVPECLIVSNREGDILFANQLALKVFDYQIAELVGKKMELLIPRRFHSMYAALRHRYYKNPSIRPIEAAEELYAIHKSGREFPVAISLSAIEEEGGLLIISAIKDITERKIVELELEELAHFDLVTHLPNRVFFYEVLKRAILNSQGSKKKFALLYLDFDDFKKINDTYGHNLGDKFLEYASQKFQTTINGVDFVARLGGDEFCVLIERGEDSLKEATDLAQQLINDFQLRYDVDTKELHSSISIGIVQYPSGGVTVSSLMKSADLAMYRAKKLGKNTYHIFADELHNEQVRQMEIELHLRHAIEREEFSLVYQPQLTLQTGKIYGYEALLRWKSKSLGDVSPAEFIPIAENTGLIAEIGAWVLERACQQFQTWTKEKRRFKEKSLVLSVNISVLQLIHGNFVALLDKLLKQLHFNPPQLVLEITETAIMSNLKLSAKVMKEIHQLGIGIAIDDFGMGYSSLSYLKILPFTILKIDQSFVKDITTHVNVDSIVKAIIQLGFGLDLNLIAEGIETKQQLDFLKAAGCVYGQGYYLSYPLAPNELIKFLSTA
jgi:diguanylate cyclase (GGDEF)-like protein/PAS domain S-box-containing protein